MRENKNIKYKHCVFVAILGSLLLDSRYRAPRLDSYILSHQLRAQSV